MRAFRMKASRSRAFKACPSSCGRLVRELMRGAGGEDGRQGPRHRGAGGRGAAQGAPPQRGALPPPGVEGGEVPVEKGSRVGLGRA